MEDSIKGIVPHVLSFAINEFCKNGFLLAYEKELSDLKGLVDADSNSDYDYELLRTVDDEVVKLLLTSVDKALQCLSTYFMINNMDEMEIFGNEEYNLLASDNYYCYLMDWGSQTYTDLVDSLPSVYLSMAQMLYHTSCQLELMVIDVPDETYDEFHDRYYEILDQKLHADDKNVALLYDLMIELNEDLLEISRLS
ncbi:hypothetical protein [Pedobacter steynii]|uniref:Uncharacterized protein n=1 Tax=Pedobacter steynii TaxID=430522 RepID=A0A1D7QEZ7_9SPHI|nr:hypothetical protein [Pedobacter steynii]AOM77261.1 hypothetical protein BFS30_08860 [Pedobacter steynii]